MKNSIAAPALIAGLLAALLLTAIQTLWVSPLIWQAETFETAPVASMPSIASHAHDDHAVQGHHDVADDHHAAAMQNPHESAAHDHHDSAAHHHDDGEWAPEDGWQRIAFTGASNLVMAVGYALVLISLFHWRAPRSVISGLGWGFAGFAVFFGAPSLGLPPELPGTAAAEITSRQIWWVSTAFFTAAAIGLVVFRKDWLARAAAAILLLAPHLYGAPQPASHASLAPEALQHHFILATAVANGVFWLALGVCSVWLYRAWREKPTAI